MNTKIFLSSLALVLAGCGTAVTSRPGPYVKPGLVMVPVDQAGLYGLKPNDSRPTSTPPADLAGLDTRCVLTDATVTAIQYNRYADPAHPNELMHEAHIVYRRDSGPRWRLQAPGTAQQILIGPQLTDGRGEIKPLMAPELEAYLREQRGTLHREEETLTKVTETMSQLSEQQKHFAEQLSQLNSARVDSSSTTVTGSAPPREAAAPTKEPSSVPER